MSVHLFHKEPVRCTTGGRRRLFSYRKLTARSGPAEDIRATPRPYRPYLTRCAVMSRDPIGPMNPVSHGTELMSTEPRPVALNNNSQHRTLFKSHVFQHKPVVTQTNMSKDVFHRFSWRLELSSHNNSFSHHIYFFRTFSWVGETIRQ